MIPGSNLLSLALTVIAPTPVLLFAQTGRTLSSIGQWVTTYADPVTIYASVQAVPRSVYKMLGLDWQKSYVQLYSVELIQDLTRDTSGDMLEWNGRRYELQSKNDWRPIDGWSGVVGVDVGEASGGLPEYPLSATEEELLALGFVSGRAILSNNDYDYSWTVAADSGQKYYAAALPGVQLDRPLEFPEGQTRCFEIGITCPAMNHPLSGEEAIAQLLFTITTFAQFITVVVGARADGKFDVSAAGGQVIVSGADSAPAAIGIEITNTGGVLSAVYIVGEDRYPIIETATMTNTTAIGLIAFPYFPLPEDIGKIYSVAYRPYAADMTLTYSPGALDLRGEPI